MKIKEITLKNYKRFVQKQTFSFCDEDGEVNDMTLLVGDNGSGKSSVLQAIVAIVGTACGRFEHPSDLVWQGFEYDKLGNKPLVDIELLLSEEEVNPIHNQAHDVHGFPLNPNLAKNIFLGLAYQSKTVMYNFDINYKWLFKYIGSIYWYTEQRNSFSLNNPKSNVNDITTLRSRLVKLSNIHGHIVSGRIVLKENEKDNFIALETIYNRIFPNRKFLGAIPQNDIDAPEEFWLTDGNNRYEMAEMSAGECAIFPILMDFALLNINNSIIIIDEIELFLHPPLQQALVLALPKLGTNNQFIITTHSEDVAAMFHRKDIRYL